MDISKLLKQSIKFFKLAAHNSGMTLSEAASVMNSIAKKFNIESNLSRNSNENDVRRIHRRLISVMHSDVAGDSNLELLKKLNVAADTLSGKLNAKFEPKIPKQQERNNDYPIYKFVELKAKQILKDKLFGLCLAEICIAINVPINMNEKSKIIFDLIGKSFERFGPINIRNIGYSLSWADFKQIIYEVLKNSKNPLTSRQIVDYIGENILPELKKEFELNSEVLVSSGLSELREADKISNKSGNNDEDVWFVKPVVKLKDFTASNQQLPKIKVVKPVEKFTNLQDIFDDIGIPYSTDAVGIKDNFKIIVTNANDYIYVVFTEKLQNGTYKAAYGYMPMTDFKNEPINIKRLVHFVANVNDNNLRDMKFAGKNGLLSDIDSLKGLYN